MAKEKSALRRSAKAAAQRILITLDLFGKNELGNHAAAGAYGFLLSAAPALLIAAFFLSRALSASPDSAARMVDAIPSVGGAFDAKALAQAFLATPLAGISGIFAFANLLWTARVFGQSVLGGVSVAFADPPGSSPLRRQALTFAIEGAALVFLLANALGSRGFADLLRALGLGVEAEHENLRAAAFAVLGFLETTAVSYLAYRHLPRLPPKPKAALQGAVFCAVAFEATAIVFRSLANLSRYDLVYGVLGGLIVLLANVYFFFAYFFLGAQLAFVTDSFDALAFSRLRRVRAAGKEGVPALERKLFAHPDRLVSRYSRFYKAGETVFGKGESNEDVYFVLDGEIGIYLDGPGGSEEVATVGGGTFFGEMAYLLSEARTARAAAKRDASVLVLPPDLFERVMLRDQDSSRQIVASLSSRLKRMNEARSSPSGPSGEGNGAGAGSAPEAGR